MTTHKQLRSYMERNRITGRMLAEQLDLRPEYVSRVLSGAVPMTPSFIGKFYLVYGSESTIAVFGDSAEVAGAGVAQDAGSSHTGLATSLPESRVGADLPAPATGGHANERAHGSHIGG